MKYFYGCLIFVALSILIVGFTFSSKDNQYDFKGKTIDIKSADGLTIKADLYEIDTKDAPVILLFHQAGYSRGEYRPIAPRLNELGFNCIAIDQRSGKGVNDVVNETFLQAEKRGMGTGYPDAYPDLEAALKYVKEKFIDRKIIVWGSSYSSSLVFILANKNPDVIDAVLSFSPGEYFEFENKKIYEFASDVKCPVFITSAKNENESWANIFNNIRGENKTSFLPKLDGFHGSKALWKSKKGHEEYWSEVENFLSNVVK